MALPRRKIREAAARSCRLFALFLVLGCVVDPWQAWSQSTAFEFFPLYDGMERSYTVQRFNYKCLRTYPPEVYDLYQGDVKLRVMSHKAQPGGIVWSIRQEMDVKYTPLNTPPTRISGVDTVRLLESDSGRHELRIAWMNSRAGLTFPWNFPYRDGLRTEAEAVSLYRSYTGPPSYVFETFKDVGVGGSMCRIRFIRNFGIDSVYTDRFTGTNYSITYRFRARLIGPAIDSNYLGMLRTEDSTRRAIVDLGFALLPNHPNPVVSETSVAFSVPREAHVRIVIQDLFGRHIATIADEVRPFGRHAATLDATRLASGMYLMRMESEGNIRMRSMVVRK